MIRACLSAKADNKFFDHLCEKIQTLGGRIEDCSWNLGPSIQVTTYAITLPQGQLTIQENTEGNCFVEGDDELVSFLIEKLLPKTS